MKKTILAFAVTTSLVTPALAQETVHVRGYVKKDGTYVEPSNRTAPNDTKTDNWSSRPNVNPYTGKTGTVDPNAPPKPEKPKYGW